MYKRGKTFIDLGHDLLTHSCSLPLSLSPVLSLSIYLRRYSPPAAAVRLPNSLRGWLADGEILPLRVMMMMMPGDFFFYFYLFLLLLPPKAAATLDYSLEISCFCLIFSLPLSPTSLLRVNGRESCYYTTYRHHHRQPDYISLGRLPVFSHFSWGLTARGAGSFLTRSRRAAIRISFSAFVCCLLLFLSFGQRILIDD